LSASEQHTTGALATRVVEDPRTRYPRPPFPRPTADQSSVRDIDPRPDHGEDTYVGSARLMGMQTLVTGGDSGIGRAVAIAFAREGANVAIVFHDERSDADETVRLIEASGQRGLAIRADLAREDDCRSTVAEVIDAFGRIDVLVNNAATQRRRDAITDIPTDEWERILRTNLTAPFWLCREAADHMEPGSSIINVASIQASKPSGPLLAYATTKGGLVTFSKALAELLMAKGIRVNVVAPGPVWTPLVASTTDPEELTTFGGGTLLGRPAQPAELAGAFVFLASEAASYITGEVVAVTGGEIYG
jgi:NAD(P)-dependent dehydrogenase (short-subunit alcohol dehydrogenase family)